MLTFKRLREANLARNEAAYSPCGDWTKDDWLLAIGGEVGELENIFKKTRRGDFTIYDVRQDIADELADVVTYLDLIHAYHAGGRRLVGDGGINVLLTGTLYPTAHSPVMRFHYEFARMSVSSETRDCVDVFAIVQCWDACAGLADFCGIDLEVAIINKFNTVSDRIGSEVRLCV